MTQLIHEKNGLSWKKTKTEITTKTKTGNRGLEEVVSKKKKKKKHTQNKTINTLENSARVL